MLEVKQVHERTPFAREWLRSAREQQHRGDVFSAFFSAYIALVVCCTQIRGDLHGKVSFDDEQDDKLEGIAIEEAMKFKCQEIAKFLDCDIGRRISSSIWQRQIPENHNIQIIGSGASPILKQAAKKLEKYFRPGRLHSLDLAEKEDQALQLAIVFRKVRNRLFHGGKMNDPNGSDADLLNKINPLLIEIVEILQRH
jgi:hypothetical protein